jgi:hypothetical protein
MNFQNKAGFFPSSSKCDLAVVKIIIIASSFRGEKLVALPFVWRTHFFFDRKTDRYGVIIKVNKTTLCPIVIIIIIWTNSTGFYVYIPALMEFFEYFLFFSLLSIFKRSLDRDYLMNLWWLLGYKWPVRNRTHSAFDLWVTFSRTDITFFRIKRLKY